MAFMYILSDVIHMGKFLLLGGLFLALNRRKSGCALPLALLVTVGAAGLNYCVDNVFFDLAVYVLNVLVVMGIVFRESCRRLLLVTPVLIVGMSLFDQMMQTGMRVFLSMFWFVPEKYVLQVLTSVPELMLLAAAGYFFHWKFPEGIGGIKTGYMILFMACLAADCVTIEVLGIFVTDIYQGQRKQILQLAYIFVILGVLVQLGLMVVLIWSRNLYREKQELTVQYLDMQKSHYEYLESRETETRKFRHDLRNHMFLLGTLYKNQNYEEFGAYLEEINGRIEAFGNKVSVNNGIADAVLNRFWEEADRLGIALIVKGHFPMVCGISAYDICTIFSNLLENAIWAESKCGGTEITVDIRYTDEEILVRIENDTEGESKMENGHFVTSKTDKRNHGFGLENVRECVVHNQGYMEFLTEGGQFKVMLSLRY